jgi:hypothetical protein
MQVIRRSTMNDPTSEAEAMRVLDEFMVAFNTRTSRPLAATFNFPHVRIASGTVKLWQTPADLDQDRELGTPLEQDWHRTSWDWREVVQSSANKVHVLVAFTRFSASGAKIGTFESLYIITKQNGHWGVQARSSFAQ